MSVRHSNLARISKGAATFSAVAVLMTAGFAAPANAAVVVPFQPAVSVGVQSATQTGTDIPLTLTVDSVMSLMSVNPSGTSDPVTVKIDVYGAYAPGTIPAGPVVPVGTTPVATGTFVAVNGPGTYALNATNFSLGNFQYNPGEYTYVASIIKAGVNANAVTGDAVSDFGVPSATTTVALALAAPPVPSAPPVVVTPPTSRPVPVGGSLGRGTRPTTTSPSTTPVGTTSPAISTGTAVKSASFANCAEAAAAGKVNIPKSDPAYAAKLDRNSNGIACEDNGSDTAVTINGGFARAASTDSTPFIAGGVFMILLALGAGTSVFARKNSATK